MKKYSDIELLKYCLQKNNDAQKELYRRYAPKMYAICLRFVRINSEADDLLQEGWIKVFQNLNTYNFQGSFETWIKRIFINNCINYYKKNLKNNDIFFDDIEKVKSDNEDENEHNFFYTDETKQFEINIPTEEIMKLIQELPERKRIVFTLYVIEEYKHSEIAEMLGITEATSKTQLMKAKIMIREKLLNLYKKHNIYENTI